MSDKFEWTRERLEQVHKLRQAGIGMEEIAERLGCPYGSLCAQYSRWRKGKLTFIRERWREKRAEIEQAFLSGSTLKEIAQARSMSTPAVSVLLTRMGIDVEERKRIRKQAR